MFRAKHPSSTDLIINPRPLTPRRRFFVFRDPFFGIFVGVGSNDRAAVFRKFVGRALADVGRQLFP